MSNSFGDTYNTGTVTLTNGSATAVFAGTLLSTQAEQGDIIYVQGSLILVDSVTDDTHLVIDQPWAAATLTNVAYTLLKWSKSRYDPAITQVQIRNLLTFYDAVGFFYFVEGSTPDPGVGVDGQWALKVNDASFNLWFHTGGSWVAQGTALLTTITGAWVSTTTYAQNSAASFGGSLYRSKVAGNLNNQPDVSPTQWELIVSKGDTGPATLNPVAAWVTAHSYVVGPPADYVSNGGSSYECLVAHTSGTFATDLAAGKWGLVAQVGTAGTNGTNAPTYGGTSTTSLTIGTGAQAFTTQAGLAYQNGARVRASSAANTSNWMEGLVTYSGTTLTITVDKVGGSGTHADWNFNIAGAPGAGDLISSNNLSDVVSVATARTNLAVFGRIKKTIFASVGTFTFTPDPHLLYGNIRMLAPGGGGGGVAASGAALYILIAGGGGAGQYQEKIGFVPSDIGASATVTVGAGGIGATGASVGTAGGTTSVVNASSVTVCSATGGSPGANTSTGTAGGPGAGGSGGTGDLVSQGQTGQGSHYEQLASAATKFPNAGKGGSTFLGDGGLGGSGATTAGHSGQGYGAGGGGGSSNQQAATNVAGGGGANGWVEIIEFCSQ